MAKDYYKVLGLPRTASESEIKIAYRKLAVLHHPDKQGDPVKFQEVNEANGILGDPEKKKAYDADQSVAIVVDLNKTSLSVVEEYFSQFNPPAPTR